MTLHRIAFEAPLDPYALLTLRDGRQLPLSACAQLPGDVLRALLPDDDERDLVLRAAAMELALPGALYWHRAVDAARPSDPVWVPALRRNTRVVQLEMARDALADPWHATRTVADGGQTLSVLGAASLDRRGGDVEFDVCLANTGRPDAPTPFRYRLREVDRKHLWEHLTGLLGSLAIRRGQVAETPVPDEAAEAFVGLSGIALHAVYIDTQTIRQRVIREDNAQRRDQRERTDIAEFHGELLRLWRAECGPPLVAQIPRADFAGIGGEDDLAARCRPRASAAGAALAGLGLAAGASAVALFRRATSRQGKE